MNDSETVFPILTVDGVVFRIENKKLVVLLIKRAFEPFVDTWALPGGYVPRGETTTEALNRVLKTKTGVSIKDMSVLEQLHTFDNVGRDPRGHAVSIVYVGFGCTAIPGGQDAQTPRFLPVDRLPRLAYDHNKIIAYGRHRLQERLLQTNVAKAFLPATFTLSELQEVYEAILGRTLDKRNFRKKIDILGMLQATDTYTKGSHRPAQLYTFMDTALRNTVPDLL